MTTLKRFNQDTGEWEYVLSGPKGDTGATGAKGDKGDPGGFTTSSPLADVNLNTIITPGLYYATTTVTNRPTAAGTAYHVEVVQRGNSVMQRATQVSSTLVNRVWIRNSLDSGATWTAWVIDGEKAIADHLAAADPHPQYVEGGASVLGDAIDLDTLTETRTHIRATAANTTVANHYPFDGFSGFIEVSYAHNNHVLQKATWYSSAARLPTGTARQAVRTKYGGTWGPWVFMPAPGDQGGTQLGTGSPEGVVTSYVGAKYIDTNATNGAIEWIKTAGTGNTGWKVVYGDTGWRDVTELWTNANRPASLVGGIYFRRQNGLVSVRVSINHTEATPATTSTMLGTPAGFGSSTTGMPLLLQRGNGIQTAPYFIAGVGQTLYGPYRVSDASSSWPSNFYLQGQAAYMTDVDWPTTLPGTAV